MFFVAVFLFFKQRIYPTDWCRAHWKKLEAYVTHGFFQHKFYTDSGCPLKRSLSYQPSLNNNWIILMQFILHGWTGEGSLWKWLSELFCRLYYTSLLVQFLELNTDFYIVGLGVVVVVVVVFSPASLRTVCQLLLVSSRCSSWNEAIYECLIIYSLVVVS